MICQVICQVCLLNLYTARVLALLHFNFHCFLHTLLNSFALGGLSLSLAMLIVIGRPVSHS